MLTPSQQVIEAFDSILKSTGQTNQIVTLDLSAEEDVYNYVDKQTKMTPETVQAKIDEELEKLNVSEAEKIVLSVNLSCMNLSWLYKNSACFLDLVRILRDTRNLAIYQTAFVKSLLNEYWEE